MGQAVHRTLRFWQVPEFEDPRDARIAAAVFPTALLFAGVALIWTPLSLPVFSGQLLPPFSAGLAFIFYCIPAWLVRARRPRSAAKFFTISIFVQATPAIALLGGTGGPLASMYVLVVATAGLLLGARWAVGSAIASGLALTLLFGLTQLGILPEAAPITPLQSWAIHFTFIIFASVLVVVATITLDRGAARARKSDARFRAIAQNARDLIAELDTGGRILFANAGHEQVLAVAPEELVGRSLQELVHPDDIEACNATLRQAVEQGAARGRWRLRNGSMVRHFEYDIGAASGRTRVDALVAIGRDLTDQLESESQLAQAQRMDALGKLAGGIAHDFNNCLTVVMGVTESLQEMLAKDDPARERAQEVMEAADRAAALSRRLLAFSRRQPLQPRLVDLNQLLAGIEPMLRRILPATILLDVATDSALGSVQIDPPQFEQVLINLAINARDAMPDGGTLSIETSDQVLDRGYSNHHAGVSEGRYVCLAVSDTGVGMDADTRSHAFEPFFSTKPAELGTGLGLSMVHGIVRQSGGRIELYSEPGHGTSFKIYLPRLDAPADEIPAARATTVGLSGGETVLLVEDSAMVRRVVRRMLESHGYRVLEEFDAESALSRAARGDHFDVLVTDVILPGRGGVELVRELRVNIPDLRVVYMSGYTANGMAARGLSADAALVTKPFTAEHLLRTLRGELDTRH